MLGTYASAALICLASLLVGRAVLAVAGRTERSWIEPAVGFAAILTVTGALARAPGHGTSATLGLVLLLIVAAAVVWRWPSRGAVDGAEGADDEGPGVVEGTPAADDGAAGADDRAAKRAGGMLRAGLPVALVVALVLSIPFAISGRWGLLGVGFNNDLGLHLAWAEWLRSGFGPVPDAGYPLGPHGLAVAVAAVPGLNLGQAFIGEIFAIGILTGLTALGALGDLGPVRRGLAAVLVAVPYLAASYFAQAAFKETAEALFVLTFAIGLRELELGLRGPGGRWAANVPIRHENGPSTSEGTSGSRFGRGGIWIARGQFVLPFLALVGGIFFSYSFAGVAWPVAIAGLWSLTLPPVRRALAPRALLRLLLRPTTLIAIAALVGIGLLFTLVGPFGFVHTFNKVAGSNTYGPVSPVEALGIWPAANYRLNAAGGAQLSGLAGAIAGLAVLLGVYWWCRRRDLAVPIALGACAALYLISLPTSGDYSQAKALMIAAPLTMLVAVRPLLREFPLWGRSRADDGGKAPAAPLGSSGEEDATANGSPWEPLTRLAWTVLAVAFVGGAVYSSFLALRDAPVGPGGHGAELQAFLPIVQGQPVLYAGQDRYAAYGLRGADTHVPLVEFPDLEVLQNPEKPFDTGNAYSPIDFDSFSRGTLNRVSYVITSRAAWNSEAPANFRRVDATPPTSSGSARARRPATATCCSRAPRRGRSPAAPRRRSASSPRTRAGPPSSPPPRSAAKRTGCPTACSAPVRAPRRPSPCRRGAGASRCSTSPPSS
ncbi:MAG TPA: hypothetical protein VFL89_01245 [Solirubrobacterales bacterium]|nr:hypothetical protein [Solirubrobacterales bacterium]